MNNDEQASSGQKLIKTGRVGGGQKVTMASLRTAVSQRTYFGAPK